MHSSLTQTSLIGTTQQREPMKKGEEASPRPVDEGWRLDVLALPRLDPATAPVRCRATRACGDDVMSPEFDVWGRWPRPKATIVPGAIFSATEMRERPDGGRDALGLVDKSSNDNLLLGTIVASDRNLYKPLNEICSSVGSWFVHTIDRLARRAVDATNARRALDPFVVDSIGSIYSSCTRRYAALRRCGELPNAVLAALTPRELDEAVDEPARLLRLARPRESTSSALHPLRLMHTADGLLARLSPYRELGSTRVDMHVRATLLARTGSSYVSHAQLHAAVGASLLAEIDNADNGDEQDARDAIDLSLRRDGKLSAAVIHGTPCFALAAVAAEETRLAAKLRSFARRHYPCQRAGHVFNRAWKFRQSNDAKFSVRVRRLNASQAAAVQMALTHSISCITGPACLGHDAVVGAFAHAVGVSGRCAPMLVAPTAARAATLQERLGRNVHCIDTYIDGKKGALAAIWWLTPMVVVDAHMLSPCDVHALVSATTACEGRATSIVFVGDPHRRPAIGSRGAFFKDLASSGAVPVASLAQWHVPPAWSTCALHNAQLAAVNGATTTSDGVVLVQRATLELAADWVATARTREPAMLVTTTRGSTARALKSRGVTPVPTAALDVCVADHVVLVLDDEATRSDVYAAAAAARKRLTLIESGRSTYSASVERAVQSRTTNLAFEVKVAFKLLKRPAPVEDAGPSTAPPPVVAAMPPVVEGVHALWDSL